MLMPPAWNRLDEYLKKSLPALNGIESYERIRDNNQGVSKKRTQLEYLRNMRDFLKGMAEDLESKYKESPYLKKFKEWR